MGRIEGGGGEGECVGTGAMPGMCVSGVEGGMQAVYDEVGLYVEMEGG